MDMEELMRLRERNLAYQLTLTKFNEDYKILELTNLQLKNTLAFYVSKEKQDVVMTENYAALRESWDQLSTHFLEKRKKNMELQRELFDSRKELANVKYQLEQYKETNTVLERQLEFINEINNKPEMQENESLSASKASSDESSIGIDYEKSSHKESGRVNTARYNASRPLPNRLLENARRQDRKSQSLESLSSFGRRRAAFGAPALVVPKTAQKLPNSSILNKAAKLRQQSVPQPKTPHCGPGSNRALRTNNGQASNKSVFQTSFNKFNASVTSVRSTAGVKVVSTLVRGISHSGHLKQY